MKPTHRMVARPDIIIQKLGSGFLRVGAVRKQRAIMYICKDDEVTMRMEDEFNRLFEPLKK